MKYRSEKSYRSRNQYRGADTFVVDLTGPRPGGAVKAKATGGASEGKSTAHPVPENKT